MISLEESFLTIAAVGTGFIVSGGFSEPHLTGAFGAVLAVMWLWLGIVWGHGEALLQ